MEKTLQGIRAVLDAAEKMRNAYFFNRRETQARGAHMKSAIARRWWNGRRAGTNTARGLTYPALAGTCTRAACIRATA